VSSIHSVGHRLAVRRYEPLSMTDIVAYQGASGDLNPMHHDDDLARAAGYPAAFSVGMLGAGWLASFATEVYGTGTVRMFAVRFVDLVFRGAVLEASGEVTDRVMAAGEDRVRLDLRLSHADSDVVVTRVAAEFAVAT
jgi:acyl dehydratase